MSRRQASRPKSAKTYVGKDDQVRPVTALFADIVGSTALGEFLAIDEVKALVGECVTRMSEVIERFGGVVGSFMGDGIATFFGLEAAREDDQYRAALAALEVRRVVDEYASEAKSAWGVDNLNVRIGINAGRVATGPVGGDKRQVLALGDAVNIAARFQSIADPGSIIVGDSVARALSGRFDLTPLGSIQLKGRKKRVAAFVLLGETTDLPPRPSQTIIGRELELGRMEEMLAELVLGRGQVALILGEAGIGKTRLLEEARNRAGSAVMWLGSRSSAGEKRVPYEPFVNILRSWLGVEAGTPDIAVRVRLQARLRELLAEDAGDLLPPLARLLGVRARTKADRRLDDLPAEVSRSGLHNAIVRWLRALAQYVPLVVALDGFSEIDQSTLQLGEEILAVTDEAPLCVVVTMRPDKNSPIWTLRVRALSEFVHRTIELRLESLSSGESESLLKALDGNVVMGPAVRSALSRRAEGNPLYLEELFNAVAGELADSTPIRRAELELPIALEGLLLSRIDQLPGSAKELLQAAAVLGREFSKRALEEMGVCTHFPDALSVLLRADLIRERRRDPAEFAFKHGLLREAALSTLTDQRRKLLHGLAAKSIETIYGRDTSEHIGTLAWHYLSSGERSKAVGYLEGLGERLASVYRYDQAIDVLEDCRLHIPRDKGDAYKRVTMKLAELRGRVGDVGGACELLDQLVDTADENERIAILTSKAQLLAEAGNFEAASELVRTCLTLPSDELVVKRLTALAAQLCLRRQDFKGAKQCLEAIGNLERLPPEVAFDGASLWAGYLVGVGDFAAAKPWGERALALAQSLGRTSLDLRSARQLGLIELLNGRIRAGYSLLRGVFDRSGQLGFSIAALESGVNLVHAASLLGEILEAEEISESMRDMTTSHLWSALIDSNLATIRFERDDFEGASASASRVLAAGVEVTSPAPRIAVRTLLARVYMAERKWEAAERELSYAEEEAGPLSGRRGLAMMLSTYRGELAWRSGDWDSALAEADRALDEMELVERPVHVPALRLKGIAVGHRDPAAGRSILEDVRNMSRVMEMRVEEARTLLAIAACVPSEAPAHVGKARALFEACGCKRGLAEAEEVLEGAHRL